jgi:predicted nucleic acid-binding protein
MNPVFLDTVGLIALWNGSDQWHAAADQAFAQILDRRQPLVTTTFVLLECANAAARRPFRTQVCRLRETLEQRNELVVPIADDWKDAWMDYEQGKAGDAGIVDHISFRVMRRLGIMEAFTNDRHFQSAGFVTLF